MIPGKTGTVIKLTIDGIAVSVPEGTTILEAARKVNVHIPALCNYPGLGKRAVCRLCVVECDGRSKLVPACANDVWEGVNIVTNNARLADIRKMILELLLADHPQDCLNCVRNTKCELQTLARQFGIRSSPFSPKAVGGLPPITENEVLERDMRKCVKCGRCVEICQEDQAVRAINSSHRSIDYEICTPYKQALSKGPCIFCGQCAAVCPVGAIYEYDNTVEVWSALHNPDKHTVVQIAPAVRVALAEEFGFMPGTIATRRIYAALRRLGFNTVFDTNFSADLTIMEEGTELVKRLTGNSKYIPLVTSCCPAWVEYMEEYYADMIPNFSTAKSPQQMMGAMIKAYWADKAGVDPAKVYSVSVMPCTAKKRETRRNDDMKSAARFLSAEAGYDVDIAITTRELARMIKQAGIDIMALPEEEADNPLGPYTGAGTIFGVTGGVMEAAVRTAYFLITKIELGDVNFTPVRGLEGVKEAELDFRNGTKIRIAVAHQMGNIAAVLDKIRAARDAGKETPYHFVEVMACRGGCIGGGGQPYGCTDEIREQRTAGMYSDDEKSRYRCSHQNPFIDQVYKEFLGEPNGHKAHELLHTKYTPRALYKS